MPEAAPSFAAMPAETRARQPLRAKPALRPRFALLRALVLLVCGVGAALSTTTRALAQLVPGIPPITIGQPKINPEASGLGPVGVLDRVPDELSPMGVQTIPGLLLPSVTGTTIYDDNIFAAQSPTASDMVFHLRPDVTLRSPQGMFSYTAEGYADLVKFTQHPELSNGNLGFSLGMLQEFLRDWQIESQTAARYDHQDPSGFALPVPNATVGSLPIYTILQENLTLRYRTGRFRFAGTGGFEREDFANTTVGGTFIHESALDANIWTLGGRADYYISHLTQIFLDNTFTRREYDNRLLNSSGLETLVGAVFEYDRLIRGSFSFGWRERVYDTRNVGSFGAPSFDFNIAWFPTEVLTLIAQGAQDFADTPITTGTGSSAVVDIRSASVEADYEFTPQWVATGSVGYQTLDYSATGRADTVKNIGASLIYHMNRYMNWTALYKLSSRGSTQAGFGYERQQIGLALKVQY